MSSATINNNKAVPPKQLYTGIALAVIAAIIWAGNFIVARGVATLVPPVSLAFFRWATATIIILPFALKHLKNDFKAVKQNLLYLFFVSLTGISIFNTFIYIAGHSTSAINMALIGTTSSPVFVIIISALFLRDKINALRLFGLLFCLAGIVVLLSKGSIQTLLAFRFGSGDVWVLLAALSFAIYNVLVKRKPATISSISFLSSTFLIGTLLLLPFYLYETMNSTPVVWTGNLVAIILYLGLGTSVIAFLLWNASISKIGAVRTSLFGNLIPIIASIEAIWLLGEELTVVHLISGGLVIIGLALGNSRGANRPHIKPAAYQ
ncbi:MAG: family transporter [Segetibacter sp.]|nr:family transporter [Segetibacter sp.]